MKRIIAKTLGAVMILSMIGCGSGTENKETGEDINASNNTEISTQDTTEIITEDVKKTEEEDLIRGFYDSVYDAYNNILSNKTNQFSLDVENVNNHIKDIQEKINDSESYYSDYYLRLSSNKMFSDYILEIMNGTYNLDNELTKNGFAILLEEYYLGILSVELPFDYDKNIEAIVQETDSVKTEDSKNYEEIAKKYKGFLNKSIDKGVPIRVEAGTGVGEYSMVIYKQSYFLIGESNELELHPTISFCHTEEDNSFVVWIITEKSKLKHANEFKFKADDSEVVINSSQIEEVYGGCYLIRFDSNKNDDYTNAKFDQLVELFSKNEVVSLVIDDKYDFEINKDNADIIRMLLDYYKILKKEY